MRIAVQGIGLASAFSDSESDLKFPYHDDKTSTENTPLTIEGKYKNKFVYPSETSELASYIPKKQLRRIDHFSRMALLGAGKAMKDAGSTMKDAGSTMKGAGSTMKGAGSTMKGAGESMGSKDKMGLIVATGYGALKTTFSFLDSYIEKGDKLSSPLHFSNSVHNAAAAHISILYGITGPTLTVSQFEMSFFSALITASVWLKEGYTDSVLVGCSDEFCDVIGYCIHGFMDEKNKSRDRNNSSEPLFDYPAKNVAAKTSPPSPLSNFGEGENSSKKVHSNNSYSTGEGAAFFLLTGDKGSNKSGYGYIDEVSIQNYKKSGIDVSKEGLVVVSPGTLNACDCNFFNGLVDEQDSDILIRKSVFFPTDAGFDAAFAMAEKDADKICFIKTGDDGEYGKIVFSKN